jgi:hypothetical protein
MADNVNIIVQDTINDIVVNAAVVVETIDINVQAAVDVVDIVANPNNYVVNINRIIGEQVQSDWDQTDNQAPDYIKNKPSIPAAQVNSDWDATSGVAEILNKPSIPTATSDLTNDGEDGINPFITLADVPVPTNGLPAGGTAGQILTKVDATDYNATWQENFADWTSVVKHTVKNNGLSGTITKGTAVYVTGSNGTNMLVGRASNTSEATSSKTMGLMQSDITTTGGNQTGFVITEGLIQGLNTAGQTAGDPVWLGVNGALIYGLANKPYAPAHLVFIGIVTKISAGNGEIFVKVQNGFELKEIHDVDIITTTPINGHLLGFDGTLWVNKTIATWLGFTPQEAITLTTTGSSGAATLVGATLNIPQYSGTNIYNADGTLTSARTLTSGGFPLTFTGINTAASAIARGLNLTHTLIAAANSDVLVGLDINPTFTNGAFTGVSTFGLRLNKSITTAPATFTNTNDILLRNSASATSNSLVSHSPAVFYNGNTFDGVSSIPISFRQYLQAGLGGGNTVGILSFEGSYNNATYAQIASIRTGSASGSNQFRVTGNSNVISSVPANSAAFIAGNGSAGLAIANYGNGAAEMQTHNYTSIPNIPLIINRQGGNLLINTTTDAGFKLDVNGTARIVNKLSVGTPSAASALMEITSTTLGFLPPRMTTTQKNAIATPAAGLVVYDTTLSKLCVRTASSWETITSI